jgi:putative chitinase
MHITPEQIAFITSSSVMDATKYATPLGAALEYFDVSTPRRLAACLGQIAHESGHYRHTEELLGYSAKRLMQVWPSRFPSLASTKGYAYNPQALANQVYANRMGNGGPETGDGWRYRGRGLIQLTGAAMYARAEAALGLAITGDNSFRVALPEGAAWTACWYWYDANCNYFADAWDIEAMTKAINGGTVGLEERIELCEAALDAVRSFGGLLFAD